MLIKPYLAKCGDRNILPKSHPVSGGPEDWFSQEILSLFGFTGISFDFFVNWSKRPYSLSPIIWIKSLLEPNSNYELILKDLKFVLIESFGIDQLNILGRFSKSFGLELQFIIFDDNLNWSDISSEILIVKYIFKEDNDFSFYPIKVHIEAFKSIIRTHSGGEVQMGSKGLNYGTSNLECYLSVTNSLYPGDVDLLILRNDGAPLCILEFKKHTLSTGISLQKLSNYYPVPDARKYNRLAILKHYLNKGISDIPIIIVYYPTKPLHKEGRLELLTGKEGTLSTLAASNFNLPEKGLSTEYAEIVRKLVKAVSYHNTLK